MDKLVQTFDLEIVYRHFPLHPETPRDGMTLEELFAGRDFDLAAAQARMSQLMKDEGLEYGERTMTYNSRLAQELAKWAETQPGGEAIHVALFRAYFVNNVNVGVPDNLVSVAEEIGLAADEARAAINDRTFATAVDSDWQRSRDLGITGVPTFVVGNQGLVGAQPIEQLQRLVVTAGANERGQNS